MPADLVHDDNPALARVARRTTPAAALAALGIVYGDLGTSPLYTLQAVVGATGGHFSSEAARAKELGCPIDLKDGIYFGARDTVVSSNSLLL